MATSLRTGSHFPAAPNDPQPLFAAAAVATTPSPSRLLAMWRDSEGDAASAGQVGCGGDRAGLTGEGQ